MKIAIVAAVARNRVIGAGGELAWRISDDLKWFKKITLGKPIIMGRKTYSSIGRPLPGRDNIVITRANDFVVEGVLTARSIPDALALARECADRRKADEICVIGGGEIYEQMLTAVDRIYMTRVAAEIDGDTLFPEIDSAQWDEKRQFSSDENHRNDHACEFFILDRRANKAEKP